MLKIEFYKKLFQIRVKLKISCAIKKTDKNFKFFIIYKKFENTKIKMFFIIK